MSASTTTMKPHVRELIEAALLSACLVVAIIVAAQLYVHAA